MKQTLMKLVDEILQRMDEHPDAPVSETGIRRWLTQQGYKKSDIDDALRLLRPRVTQQPSIEQCRSSYRVLTDYERAKLRPEARDALARLERYELIHGYEREMILDRLSHFDATVGLDELDYLLQWVVSSTRDYESQRVLFDTMDSSPKNFH
jgi:uncharacterized protein Smg (DUF494 family)